MIGTSLTHYRITAKLGEGGMGEVYRATDTKLGREVAIKVLPANFSRDPVSLARFEREAKALAALNHPHIAGIYGFDADQGNHFIVLELVEGETLGERLRRGPLPVKEALTVARQMAEALQEAHEKGIIHRDLKPGNVKLTPNGRVKVLDFGLAKMEQTLRGDAEPANDPEAPTMRDDTTLAGTVMGTPAYMSPEQARGQEVDKRTDIWAFGCCLYECLSGRKPFRGQTASDLMAEVLKSEPDWSQLPAETPPAVVTLLRRCLEKDASRRLSSIGDIAITLEESTRGSAPSSSPQISQPPNAPSPSSLSVEKSAKWLRPVLAGLLIFIIGAGIFYWKRSGAERNAQAGSDRLRSNAVPVSPPPSVAASTTDQKSIAVLAFANLSEDKGNEYFSDGISEELLNVLAKVPGLKVSARTSAFFFKGKQVPLAEIAQQLGVAYVVEGSVRKSGTRVRITAQLIKAADGFHVWSDNFDRELKDIFAVQDEIAGLIAKNLALKLGDSSRAAKVVNPEAHRLVLEGRHFWNLRNAEGFTRGEAAFQQAIRIDPLFAEAHAGLAGVCVIRAQYGLLEGTADPADVERANAEARLAIELDPTLADGHAVFAFALMQKGEFAEAESRFRKAIALNPNSEVAHCWLGLLLSVGGRLDASTAAYVRASELDPLWFINLLLLTWELNFTQRWTEALAMNDRAMALRGDVFPVALGERALSLFMLGRKTEAIEAARALVRVRDLGPRWSADGKAIWVLAQAGLREEAEAHTAHVIKVAYPQSTIPGYALAALGRFDEARPYLELTSNTQWRELFWSPMFDPWRGDARFQQLLVKLNCVEEYKVARATLARILKERETKK